MINSLVVNNLVRAGAAGILLGASLIPTSGSAKPPAVFLGDNNTSVPLPAIYELVDSNDDGGYYTIRTNTGDTSLWRLDESAQGLEPIFHLPFEDSYVLDSVIEKDGYRYVLADGGERPRGLYKLQGPDVVSCVGGWALLLNNYIGVAGDNIIFSARADWDAPSFLYAWTPDNTTVLLGPCPSNGAFESNGTLAYYLMDSELWRTDGTVAGTFALTSSSDVSIDRVYGFLGDQLLFSVDNEADYSGYLSATQGTVGDIVLLDSTPSVFDDLYFSDDHAFFEYMDGPAIRYLKTDGTPAGTIRYSDLTSLGFDGEPYFLGAFQGDLIVLFFDDNRKIVRTDDTPAGTTLLGEGFIDPYVNVLGDHLYVEDMDWLADMVTIYVGDGSEGNLEFVTEILYPEELVDFTSRAGKAVWLKYKGGVLSFVTHDPVTKTLTDLGTPNAATPFPARNFVPFNDRVLFAGYDGLNGVEHWASDGTPAGTQMLGNFATKSDIRQTNWHTALAGDTKAYFPADEPGGDETNPFSLVQTDGTALGTTWTQESYHRSSLQSTRGSVVNGDRLYYLDQESDGVYKFKVTDGVNTTSTSFLGTKGYFVPVKDTVAAVVPRGSSSQLVIYNMETNTFDRALTGYNYREFLQPAQYVQHDEFTVLTIFIDSSTSYLVKTDGTPDGTTKSDFLGYIIGELVLLNDDTVVVTYRSSSPDQIRFAAMDINTGVVTTLLELDYGLARDYTDWLPTDPLHAVLDNGKLVFGAPTEDYGVELWITDGTPAGTQLLKDINPGADSSRPIHFTAAGEHVYFAADDGTTGRELWRTDGTEAGTIRITDLNPGSGNGLPYESWMHYQTEDSLEYPRNTRTIICIDGSLLFPGNDGTGFKLWYLSGPEGFPQQIDLPLPGSGGTGSSLDTAGIATNPGNFIHAGEYIIFDAETPETGRDLWSVNLDNISSVNDWSLY